MIDNGSHTYYILFLFYNVLNRLTVCILHIFNLYSRNQISRLDCFNEEKVQYKQYLFSISK